MQSVGAPGYDVALDFQANIVRPNSQAADIRANNLWLNVRHPSLTPDTSVHAVWLQNVGPGHVPHVSEVDLKPAPDGHFTAKLPDTDLGWAYSDGFQAAQQQQLALRVGTDWVVDPLNGTHNFNVSLIKNVDSRFRDS